MNLSASFSDAPHRKRVIARAIACGLLLVLPSCHIPALRQAEQAPAVPPSFNGATSPDNSAQLRVDEFYSDPNLTRLVCQALATNRELKILEEDIQIARNEILSRRGAYLPFLGFRAGGGSTSPASSRRWARPRSNSSTSRADTFPTRCRTS